MLKKEIIWREILYQALEKKNREFTQKKLAEKFKFSTSTVFNALILPRKSGACKVKGRGFRLIDPEKLLYIWASFRNIKKDIIYQTRVEESIIEIENLMPPSVIYGGYSAFRKKFKEVPADYDKVYVYLDLRNLSEIKRRFPPKRGYPNLFVLKSDKFLKTYGKLTPIGQMFVDIWNLEDWYSKEFINALKEKINELLA